MRTNFLHISRLNKARIALAAVAGLFGVFSTGAQAAPTMVDITGEIQSLSVTSPGDHWSAGTIVVSGQTIILPRNLLLDLPANRLTLNQLFEQAPAGCLGQSGIAKGDVCNQTGMGGIAHITANRTNGGNVIAGDVFLEKGAETVNGIITYINYNEGWFAVNGNVGDPLTGTMIRINDPNGRHTVQSGAGCSGSTSNCSADQRFGLDPDNYTNAFITGYPLCIPSTSVRTFPGLPNRLGSGVAFPPPTGPTATSANATTGAGDLLCPQTNRNASNLADDSRLMAPLMLGDGITAEGNFERVNNTYFLSSHTTKVTNAALTTRNGAAGQPDYIFPDEVELDAPGYQNRRIRSLIIGYSTVSPADVMVWGIHYDPVNNAKHEFPLASSRGCDLAAGPGTCTAQGIAAAAAWDIFKIRHDADFLGGIKPRWDPCAHLRADPRLNGANGGPDLNICPNGQSTGTNVGDMMGILSPMPREVQFRTGLKLADMATGNPILQTLDINANDSPNGQYLFPFGVGLGGVGFPEFVEINLNALNTPNGFGGLPWTLDRRLSPGGCNGPCEATRQPLDPYPFEGLGLDPRLQAPAAAGFGGLPTGAYIDANYFNGNLPSIRDRIFAHVTDTVPARAGNGSGLPTPGNFGGILPWPPADPAPRLISPTPEVILAVTQLGGSGGNHPPVAANDAVVTGFNIPVTINVLANDTDPDNNSLLVTAVGASARGTVTTDGTTVLFTPNLNVSGLATFTYTISDGTANATAIVAVTVNPTTNLAPVANLDIATVQSSRSVTVAVLANDTDDGGNAALVLVSVSTPASGTAVVVGRNVRYTASPTFVGQVTFTYVVRDAAGATATGLVVVDVTALESLTIGTAQFRTGIREWRITGIGNIEGSTITARLNSTGQIIGSGPVLAGVWNIRVPGSSVLPGNNPSISISSPAGAGGSNPNFPVTVRN